MSWIVSPWAQLIRVSCEVGDLGLMGRWIELWQASGARRPDQLSLWRSGWRVVAGARRDGYHVEHEVTDTQLASAEFDLFASIATALIDAMESRAGDVPSTPGQGGEVAR